MDPGLAVDNIDLASLNALVQQYPAVAPGKLSALDEQRYESIPAALAARPAALLTKDELTRLVDWKLSHGKFRPALKLLIQQNGEQTVLDTTQNGFHLFTGSSGSAKASINVLIQLRGVGPATASLLLSVSHPSRAPFFSDELFRWCSYDHGRGKGWDREIKYNLKEYLQLFDRVQQLQQRLSKDFHIDVAAVDIEKAAYVLGCQSETVISGGHGKKRKISEDADANERRSSAIEERLASKAVKSSTGARSITRLSVKSAPNSGVRKTKRGK